MRRALAVGLTSLVLVLGGCSSGDVSRASIELGDSGSYSHAELQGAAEAVLADFRDCTPCTLLRLTYREDFSTSHLWLTTDLLPTPDADVVVFDGAFSVDWRGPDYGLNANSTYDNWTWAVARTRVGESWDVINKGVA